VHCRSNFVVGTADLGESKCGRHMLSIEPLRETRAAVLRLPANRYHRLSNGLILLQVSVI
jgi:hypothetical protein